MPRLAAQNVLVGSDQWTLTDERRFPVVRRVVTVGAGEDVSGSLAAAAVFRVEVCFSLARVAAAFATSVGDHTAFPRLAGGSVFNTAADVLCVFLSG